MVSSPIFTYILIGLAALALVVVDLRSQWQRKAPGMSMRKLCAAIAPNLLVLLFFYSLAAHMYYSLGGWPESIGEAGFPPALLVHANIAGYYFWILAVIILFAMPIALFLSMLVPVVRRWRIYIAVNALTFFCAFGLMLLAPERFLYWWWD